MRVRCTVYFFFLSTFIFSSCSDNQDKGSPQDPAPRSVKIKPFPEITIKRDIQGFPHIDAPDEASAYYALGYMQAEDYRAELVSKLALSSGRAAAMFDNFILNYVMSGAAPTNHIFGSDDLPLSTPPSPQIGSLVDLDKTVRFYKFIENAKKIYAALGGQDRMNLEAFVKGVNYAINANWETWVKEGDPRYIELQAAGLFEYRTNALDVIQNSLDLFTWGWVANNQKKIDDLRKQYDMALLKSPNPKKFAKTEKFRKLYRDAIHKITYPLKRYKSSNQWAFLGGRTGLDHSIHVTDPHIPIFDVQYNVYGFQFRYPGGMAAGGTLTGFPNLLIGTNGKIAWSHTAHADGTATAWSIEINPSNEEEYRTYKTGGGYANFQTKQYEIRLKDGSTISFTTRDTTHGRLMFRNAAAQTGAVFRLGRDGEFHTFKEYYAFTRANTVKEFQEALKMQQIPTFNTFVSDVNNIFYIYNSITPRRSDKFLWRGIMDGQNPEMDWDPNDLLTYEELPQLQNPESGYLVNCNISPDVVTENSGLNLKDYPAYLIGNNEKTFITYRQQKALQIIGDKLKEIEEYGRTLEPEDVYQLTTENRNLKFEEFVHRVVLTYLAYQPVDEANPISDEEWVKAKRELTAWWDWKAQGSPTDKRNRIAPRVFFFRFVLSQLLTDKSSKAFKDLVKGIGHYDPNAVVPVVGDEAATIIRELAMVEEKLRSLNANEKTWGEVHQISTLFGTFPLAGSDSAIRAGGGPIFGGGTYTLVTGGQTWVQAIFHQPSWEETSSRVMKPFWGPLRFGVPWYNNATERFSDEIFENFFIRKGELQPADIVETLHLAYTPIRLEPAPVLNPVEARPVPVNMGQ